MNDAPTPNQNPESDALHARLGHECFRQPTDALAKVWRYMSLPKFISLLTSNSLYMARLDKLVDQHEGSLTRRTVEEIDAYLKAAGSTKGWTEENAAFHERSRSNTFVCCWHLNEHESEAMWRLHCGSAGGVAVQTTYSNLVESISKEYDTYVGIVRYVDYATAVFESGNAFWPVMHKRAAFTHEQEVRLVRYWGDPPYPDTSPSELRHPWNVEALTMKIAVDPYQQQYFYDAVEMVVDKFLPSLLPKLCWSSIKAVPTYERRRP